MQERLQVWYLEHKEKTFDKTVRPCNTRFIGTPFTDVVTFTSHNIASSAATVKSGHFFQPHQFRLRMSESK